VFDIQLNYFLRALYSLNEIAKLQQNEEK